MRKPSRSVANWLLYREEEFNPAFYYASGMDIDHAFFISRGRQRTLLVPRMNEGIARKEFRGTVRTYTQPLEQIKELISRQKIQVDGRTLPWYLAEKLRAFCRLEDGSEQLRQQRIRKKPEEIHAIAKATRITRNILDHLELREGMQEQEVKKQLFLATIEAGVEPAFEPIVATAANARFPHYRAGKAKLREMVLIDYGVRYARYCSDVTRCFFLRKNKKMEDAYEKAQRVSEELLDDLPGMQTGGEVAKAAEAGMKKHGLPPLIHSIGHGVGLEVHEYPRLHAKSKDPIQGTTLAIEPAAYFSDFGVRYENTVYFDGKKARIL